MSTHSIWQDTQIDFKTSDFTESTAFDTIIVGAGIAGLSTAYWLEKKNPNLKLAIIDKGTLGIGASGRNAGFITCGSAEHFSKLEKQFGLNKAVEIWKFSELNRELLKSEIIQGDNASVDFFSTGSCTVAPSFEDWQRYHELIKTMSSSGIDVELIDEKYLSENYGVTNFHGAIQYYNDGVIHPIKLLKKMKSFLKNTKFFLNTEILNMQNDPQCTVRIKGKVLKAEKVILCLNGYASTLLPELSDLVKPQRGQVIVTEPLPQFVKGPCYLTKHLCYFRQLPQGELLVGGFRNHDIEAENTNEDRISEKIQAALGEFTENYFKNTKNVKINYRWSGVMGFTTDGQMILGELPTKKNLFMMAGCSGHGMGLSFNAAKVLVENIQGSAVPAHLDIQRFY